MRVTLAGRPHGAAVLALAAGALIACKSPHPGAADAGPPASDSATVTAATTIDAAPPADDAVPPDSSDELTTRVKHLLEAIAKDDAGLAADIRFPRDGWLATRDASDPGKDWEKQVAGPFRRAVHRLSRRHQKELDRAQFVTIEIGRAVTQVLPKKHGWKKPLWTTHESRITFVVDGRTRTLAVREMTAWRGAWYVTRLR